VGIVEEANAVAIEARRFAVDEQLRNEEALVRRRPRGEFLNADLDLAALIVLELAAIYAEPCLVAQILDPKATAASSYFP